MPGDDDAAAPNGAVRLFTILCSLMVSTDAHVRVITGCSDNILQVHFRVMVSLVTGGFLAILNRFFWAPLDAGKALFTFMQPYGFSCFHIYIPARADFTADIAGVTFIIDPKILIQRRHM